MAAKKRKKKRAVKKRRVRRSARKKSSRAKKKKKRVVRRGRKPSGKKKKTKRPKAVKARASLYPKVERVGEVTHYFPKVRAAAVLVKKDRLSVGDSIYIKGHTTDFKQTITSMQLDRVPIQQSKKGQEIGILVKSRVRIGDSVYRT